MLARLWMLVVILKNFFPPFTFLSELASLLLIASLVSYSFWTLFCSSGTKPNVCHCVIGSVCTMDGISVRMCLVGC